jgi:hypothetical protein
MPQLVQTVRALVANVGERAIDVMNIFSYLDEYAEAVIVPHIKPLVEMYLEFASNKTLDDGIRVKSLDCIGYLTQSKRKVR